MKPAPVLFLVFWFVLGSHVLCSQGTSIQFAAYWEMGDTHKFEITKTDQQFQNDKVERNVTNSYQAVFSVIDSTDSTYLIEWVYENQLFNETIPEEYLEAFEDFRVMTIRYETDQLGAFKGIINWYEISDLMTQLFDKVPSVLANDSLELSVVMEPLKKIFSTREGIESLVLKELQYFHWPFGLEYTILDTLTWEEYLPNMLGGRPIKANGTMYFTAVDTVRRNVKFTTELDLDEEDSRIMMTEAINQVMTSQIFANDSTREAKLTELYDFFGQMIISINDSNLFEYNYYQGWPVHIQASRKYNITHAEGTARKIEELRIKMIE